MKIWCLFSIENNYDQPPNNLVAWWKEKPSADLLATTIPTTMDQADNILSNADRPLTDGYNGTRIAEYDYRLDSVSEFKVVS